MKYKKLITVFFIVFFAASGFCNAQQKFVERTLNYERDVFQSQGMAVAALNNNTWVTAGWLGPCSHAFITAYNENNSAVWTNKLYNIRLGAADVSDLTTTSAGNDIIAVGGYGYGGNVIGDFGSFITKLDKHGKPLWQIHYNKDTFSVIGNRILEGVTETPDGYIFAFTKDKGIVKVDSAGYRIWEKSINTDSIFDIASTLDNGLLLATKSGLSKIDKNGDLLWSKTLTQSLIKITRLNTGHFAAISQNTIYLFDSSGIIVRSALVKNLGSFGRFHTMGANKKTIFIASSLSDTLMDKCIFSLDQDKFLYATDSRPTILKYITTVAKDIAANDSFIVITGTEFSPRDPYINSGYAGNQVFRSFIKSFSVNGNTLNPGNDAGIVGVIPSGTVKATRVNTGNDTVFIYNLSMPVDVVIKNFGSTVLDSVSVVSLSWWGMNCFGASKYKLIKNLALQPGDSVRVFFDIISADNRKINKPVEFRFSVNTVSPNGMLDYNVNNDMLSNIITQTVTDIETQNHPLAEVNIYPNPAAEIITIESAAPITGNISVINTLGQEIISAKATGENTIKLNVNEIPAGVYFVKIHNGNMTSTFRSFVVSR